MAADHFRPARDYVCRATVTWSFCPAGARLPDSAGSNAAALAAAALNSYLQDDEAEGKLCGSSISSRAAANPLLCPNPADDESGDEDQEGQEEWREQVRFTAVIEERQRLARELHDAVSQQLFAISMTATAVSRTMEKDWERAKRQVQLIEEMAAVAQSEMRALLLHLRPVHLDGKNLSSSAAEPRG